MCIYSFLNSVLQEQTKPQSRGAGVKAFSGRAGTFTVLLYCFNMSFTPSLKRPRCETDGIIMKIKESAVERHGIDCVFLVCGEGGTMVCFGERVLASRNAATCALVALLDSAAVTGQMGEIDHKFQI